MRVSYIFLKTIQEYNQDKICEIQQTLDNKLMQLQAIMLLFSNF